MPEYDNEQLTQLYQQIEEQFNKEELRALCFRLGVDYENLDGQAKATKALELVKWAKRRGRITDLVALVKKARPDGPHPRRGPGALPVASFGYEQRLQDLKGHIEREMQLLREYEALYDDTRDPRDKRRYQAEIDRQKASLANYRQQLEALAGEVNAAADTAPAESVSLADVMAGITAVQHQLTQVGTDLTVGQEAILDHIEQQHQQTIATLLNKMDANQLELVDLLLDAADQQLIAQWEAQQLTMLTQQALVDLKRLRQNQPDAAQWQNLLDLLARETGWQQKLKLTVPLVPGLVEFESEMAMDVVPALKEAWQRLVNKFRR